MPFGGSNRPECGKPANRSERSGKGSTLFAPIGPQIWRYASVDSVAWAWGHCPHVGSKCKLQEAVQHCSSADGHRGVAHGTRRDMHCMQRDGTCGKYSGSQPALYQAFDTLVDRKANGIAFVDVFELDTHVSDRYRTAAARGRGEVSDRHAPSVPACGADSQSHPLCLEHHPIARRTLLLPLPVLRHGGSAWNRARRRG